MHGELEHLKLFDNLRMSNCESNIHIDYRVHELSNKLNAPRGKVAEIALYTLRKRIVIKMKISQNAKFRIILPSADTAEGNGDAHSNNDPGKDQTI